MVEVVDDVIVVDITEEVIEVEIGEGVIPPEWGMITGELADQRDLQAALDEKADADDLGALALKDKADWDTDIDNIPPAFPPAAHDHDGRYYTEAETDALLAEKSDLDHTHDDRYYTESEMDALLIDKAAVIVCDASGAVASFSDGSPAPVADLTAGIEPVQSGSGDPAPDNVRPISGWTGCSVMRTGKNLLPGITETQTIKGITYTLNADGSVTCNGTADAVSYCLTPKINLKAGVTYILTGCPSGGGDTTYRMDIRDTPTTIHPDFTGIYDYGSGATFTPVADVNVYFAIRIRNNYTAQNVVFYPMLRLASETDGTYEPYNGTNYSVSFGDAGTVYGASLDVPTGVLTVDRSVVNLGALNWTRHSSGTFYASNFGQKYDRTKNICSALKLLMSSFKLSDYDTYPDNIIGTNNSSTQYVYVKCTAYSISAEFKAAMSGVQFVYPLAEPVIYQLTPVEVSTILGNNTISADTGPVALHYRADTKLYIDGKFAELQALILEN